MKGTKSRLIVSILLIIGCLALTVGASFAWFTDSITNSGNKIQAGTLSADLIMYNGTEYISIADRPGSIFKETMVWEPGCTHVVYLGVRNTGSLALKYNIILNITDGGLVGALEYALIDGAKAEDLSSVTNWEDFKAHSGAQTGKITAGKMTVAPNGTLDGVASGVQDETDYFAVAVHMLEGSGNDYKGKSVDIDVTVPIKQASAEEDGFGDPDYDSGAEYPGMISSEESLIAAIENGGEYKLVDDIELTQPATIASGTTLVLDLNGNDLSCETGYAFESNGDLTINGDGIISGLGGIKSTGGTLTINGGTFAGSSDYSVSTYQHTLKAENSTVIINDGIFDATINNQTNAMIGVAENSEVIINGGTFRNVKGALSKFDRYLFNYEENGKLIINDGTFYGGWRFNGTTASTDIYGGDFTVSYDGQSFGANNTHKLTVHGGTFRSSAGITCTLYDRLQSNGADHIAAGFTAKTDESSGVLTVVPAYRENEVTLTAEQVNAGSIALAENTTYYFESGEYNGEKMQFYLHGKENVAFIADGEVTVNGDMTVGYHMGQDGNNELKTSSTLIVSGFTVNGDLKVSSADQKAVISGNTVNGQITVNAFKINGMDIEVRDNVVDGREKGAHGYGLYIVPEVTNYDLIVSGNTFRNIYSHVVSIQGNGQGQAETSANSIQLTGNTFESWGTNGNNNRGAFKIWEDNRFAPNSISDESGLTDDAKILVSEILAGGNQYLSDAVNTVKFEFYGYGFDKLS